MIATTVRLVGFGGRRRHLSIGRSTVDGTWALQWANPTEHGYKYDSPLPGRWLRRNDALAAKRKILDGGSP